MSRVIVFDLQNYSVGEFDAMVDRGWAINGVKSSSGGASTGMIVPRDVLETGWIRPGRMVLVTHASLPAWAGVIDTPMSLAAPAEVTLYNAEYLLALRTPDTAEFMTGNAGKIITRMVEGANTQEDLYLRMGTVSSDKTYREETLDGRSYWEQMEALLQRSDSEMVMRPMRSASDGNRLFVYVDVMERMGGTSALFLHDGEGANLQVLSATLEREIWNRVTGVNGADAEEERLWSGPHVDAESVGAFRLRSKVVQFRDTVLQDTLERQTKSVLEEYAMPVLTLSVNILDVGGAFGGLRLGDTYHVHASNVVLPDGKQGWRGEARLMAMAYNEQENTVGAVLEAKYETTV